MKQAAAVTTLEVAFVVTVLFSAATGFSTSNFTEKGDCQGEQMCLYDYTVEQHFGTGGEGQSENSSITAEVGIMCDSVGAYNEKDAVMYCMTIRDVELQGTMFQDEENANLEQDEYRQRYILEKLAGHFCFVQTSNGKVPAVYYTVEQSDETINFKKGIASAFQANFIGTETEEEIDPQSIHISHYQRVPTEQEGTVKMHRSVREGDVIAYTTGAHKRDLKLTKEEDIEYQSGKLRHSSGNTRVKVSRSESTENDEENQQSFSSVYSASGSYSLDLKQCSPIVKRAYSRHRRTVSDKMEGSKMEENLIAKYNQTKAEIEEMEVLREKMPSVIDVLSEVAENHNDTKTVDTVERLLELENKHGPLPGFSPALSDVLEYFSLIQESTNPDDEYMRAIVYSLLVAESSFQSQMVLLDALNAYAVSKEEKTLLINEIAMMKNPHLDFVCSFKDYYDAVTRDMEVDEPLLLALGALASEASLEVEEFVVSFLLDLESKTKLNVDGETDSLTTLILAIGNTGSKLVVNSLLSYMDNTNEDIQVVTLQALRKFTFNPQILDKLELLLAEQSDEDILVTVIEVLIMGLEYTKNKFDSEHFDAHIDFLNHHPILTTLVKVTMETNNTKFDILVETFLKSVGGEQANSLLNHFHSLSKRGTDWDATNSVYNLVASLSERQSDVNRCPKHRAYIWGERFGIDQANLKVAAGGFAGISNDYNYIKVYGRAKAEGNVLGRSETLADILLDLRKTSTRISGRVYVYLAGNTLVDNSRSYQLSGRICYTYGTQLGERRYRLFRFSYSVFVYVTTITFYVEMHATLSIGFDAQVCCQAANSQVARATAGFTPRIGATVGGGVTANLLAAARGGIAASASFVYQLEPRAEAEACTSGSRLVCKSCTNVYDSWPGNYLDIETWYQTRTVRMCGRWVRYPCGIKWGRRRRWDAFSWRWSLGSRSRRALYESCYGTLSSNSQCPRI